MKLDREAQFTNQKHLFVLAVMLWVLARTANADAVFQQIFSFNNTLGSSASLVRTTDGAMYGTSLQGGALGYGLVFRVSTNGTFAPAYSFRGGSDGAGPGVLVQGEDGNLYGITKGNSTRSQGTFFRMATNGSLVTLHSFESSVEGAPTGLVLTRDGNFYGTTSNGGNGLGTIFRITTNGDLSTLHSFVDSEGYPPQPVLVEDSEGNLYGTASHGGALGFGTVFRRSTNGTMMVLHSFGSIDPNNFNFLDGACPAGGLVRGSDGKLYGTTAYSGYAGAHSDTLFRISTNGDLTTLYTFSGGTDGSMPLAALIQTPNGDLCGACATGGAGGGGTLFRVSTNGLFTLIHALTQEEGGSPQAALVLGDDGDLYGTTLGNEPYLHGTVFRVNASGTFTLLQRLTVGTGSFPSDLAAAADGNLYGITALGGDCSSGVVFRAGTNTTVTILYTFCSPVYPVSGLVEGSPGLLYGTGAGAEIRQSLGTIYRIMPDGTFTSLYSFTGGSDGARPAPKLGLAKDGSFYGTTGAFTTSQTFPPLSGPATVFRFTPDGTLTTLYTFQDGTTPNGLVQCNDGNLYGTVPSGGTDNKGTIFRITTNGLFSSLYSFTGGGDGDSPLASLMQASDGDLYGTTSKGGTHGYGTIFRLTTNGFFSSVYSFAGSDGANPNGTLVQTSDGWLYGTTVKGGAWDCGTIFRIGTNALFSSVYSFAGGYGGANPTPTVTQATDGWFYGTTSNGGMANSGTIFRFLPETANMSLDGFRSELLADSTARFSFPTQAGRQYFVSETANLATPNWLLITNLVGNGSRFECSVRTAQGAAWFYKVSEQ